MLKRNKGVNANRLSREVLEKFFAEEWDQINGSEFSLELFNRTTLSHILDETNHHHPPEPSRRDYEVAATVIQWLGSSVGQGFIHDVKAKMEARLRKMTK